MNYGPKDKFCAVGAMFQHWQDMQEIEEQCRLWRKKQPYIKQFKMWLQQKLERYCVKYIGNENVNKIKHTRWERFKFKIVSKLEFKLR